MSDLALYLAIEALLLKLEARLMSVIGDKLNEVEASLDAAISRVQVDVDALKAQIADL